MTALTALVANRVVAIVVVLLGALLAGAAFAVPKPEPETPRSENGLDGGYQSVQAERALAGLPSSEVAPVIVVLSREDGQALGPDDLAAVEELTPDLAEFALDGQVSPPQPSPDGTVALVAVPLAAEDDPDQPETVQAVGDIRATLDELPAGLVAEATGGPAFGADIDASFDGADVTLLLASAAVVAVILLLTYRSPLLLVVPLAVVAVTELASAQVNQLILPAVGLPNDPGSAGITAVLVFGSATDYALLLIARYREQLRTTPSAYEAMRHTVRTTAPAILASGTTVILAVLTLLLSSTEFTISLGVSAAVGVALAMVAALVVLPSALVVWKRAVFWPFMPRHGSEGREGRVWGYLGRGVLARPRLVAGLGTLVLAVLASGGLGLQTGLPQNDQFRVEPESVRGAETLAEAFPAGASEPVVVSTTPERVEDVAAAAAEVEGVVSAEPGEADDSVAQVQVVLDSAPGSQDSYDAVDALRATVADADPGAAVGGTPASTRDLSDAQTRDFWVVAPIVLALILVVLIVLLRSLLAPVLLVLTVVATYLASIGAAWVLFRSALFDFPGVETLVPLIAFVFLVALGVDYNIFLVTRAREESERHGTREGMLTALRVTGGVITSAGILLAAVFVVLGVLPVILLTQLGVIVCIGVLLDTLLVRTVIVPALAFLTGERFWWPARVHRGPDAGDGVDAEPARGGRVPEPVGAGELRPA